MSVEGLKERIKKDEPVENPHVLFVRLVANSVFEFACLAFASHPLQQVSDFAEAGYARCFHASTICLIVSSKLWVISQPG